MRIVGVLDVLEGRAVHARGGMRADYVPVQAVSGCLIEPGNVRALADVYVSRLGLRDLYIADLDAILGASRVRSRPQADPQTTPGRTSGYRTRGTEPSALGALVAALADLDASLWLDAGVSTSDDARRALDLGVSHVIVGLETLSSFGELEDICRTVGGSRVVFSLDVRRGRPIATSDRIDSDEPAHLMAARAAAAGPGTLIVLDLARVGLGEGPNLDLVAGVRGTAPDVTILTGGGIRHLEDLKRLADAGCDGALVATALHDGRIGPDELLAARGLAVPSGPTS